MIESAHKERSASALLSTIQRYSDAGGGIIHVRTREPLRAAVALREQFTVKENPYYEWSPSNGFRTFTPKNFVNNLIPGDPNTKSFVDAFERPIRELRDPKSNVCAASDRVHYFAYLLPATYMQNNPYVLDLLYQYASVLPTSNVGIILITEDATLPMVPGGLILPASMPSPTVEELSEILSRVIHEVEQKKSSFPDGHDMDEDAVTRVSVLGLGLSLSEFENYAALTVIEAAANAERSVTEALFAEGIAKGKTAVVQQSEILELVPPGDIDNVGGMRRLKDWVAQRANCYSEDARAFGVEPPKGFVVAGVPGTGKSLLAKATASTLRIPLVRLDFGRVFSKYVGDSESRVRAALAMVEAMAPCVLFVDEIDKGLGGVSSGGGGDSGISQRVLGTYLTWLQELRAPVFNIVTANRVNGLPPELTRRGRFDQIFSVGLPGESARRDVLGIHLRLRGRSIDDFDAESIRKYLDASAGFVPAEIESAVKDGLILAYSAGEEFSMDHVLSAMREIIPLSQSHAADIAAILSWAKENAIPVSYPEDDNPVDLGPVAAVTRRLVTPNRARRPAK